MKMFLLVFEDLLSMNVPEEDRYIKPVTRKARAENKEDLTAHLGLLRRKMPPTSYWDGKTNDVVISIYEISVAEILNKEELNEFVAKLHCDWY